MADSTKPAALTGALICRNKAFGVNHAETHMREGKWPEVTEIMVHCRGHLCLARSSSSTRRRFRRP